MNYEVGDLVKALAGPMVGEIGKVVAIGVDGLLHVLHLNGTFAAHYAPDQVIASVPESQAAAQAAQAFSQPTVYVAPTEPGMPHGRQARKETPTYSGFRKYFPDAIAEVAKVSFVSNEDHNPGEPLHWSRGKSSDHLDAADRHLTDYASGRVKDPQGRGALAQAAWRLLAQIQLDVEAEQAGKKEGK